MQHLKQVLSWIICLSEISYSESFLKENDIMWIYKVSKHHNGEITFLHFQVEQCKNTTK